MTAGWPSWTPVSLAKGLPPRRAAAYTGEEGSMELFVSLVAGLIAGSFLTVFVDRLRDGRNFISGRSTCDSCHKKLGALDLVPLLSWLALRGRCRHCRKSVSWRYPAVELITGLGFAAFYWFWPHSFEGWDLVLFVGWLPVLVALLALAVYDLRWWLLPNKIVYPLLAWSLLLVLVRFLDQTAPWVFVEALFGLLAGGGLFYLLFKFSSKYIGGGDVKLGFCLGLLLLRWELALMMIFLSAILATLWVLPALLRRGKKKTLQAKIQFGPFMIAAALLVFWFGQGWLDWYLTWSTVV